jgi:threonine/homoserine/homoserine lactone efflux protein
LLRHPTYILSNVLATLAAFLAVSAVVICTPGQDTALTIRNTLTGGRRNGFATAFGVACGQALWTLAASAGLVALFAASEPVFHTLRLFGALYLVYLGAHSLRRALTPGTNPDAGELPERSRHGFRQGVLSNLGNPKMAVFFATLLPQFAPSGAFLVLLALGLIFCSLTLGWLALYAVAISKARRLIRGRVRRALNAANGLVLSALGLRLATGSGVSSGRVRM